MEQPIKVKILDHEYFLRSDVDREQIQRIARFVDEKFREVKNNTEGLSEGKTALLAAFHIASDYFQALKEHDETAEEFQKRAKSLNFRIDSVLK